MSDLEVDFLNDLEDDFGEDMLSEEENTEKSNNLENGFAKQTPIIKQNNAIGDKDKKDNDHGIRNLRGTPVEYLKALKKFSKVIDFSTIRIEDFNPEENNIIANEYEHIVSMLNEKDDQFLLILPLLNDLNLIIRHDIEQYHKYITLQYNIKFSELEVLVPNHIVYANVVKILEIDNSGKNNNIDQLSSRLENVKDLTKEQILVLTMSMKTSFNEHIQLNALTKEKIFMAISIINRLESIQNNISEYIESNIHYIAPNITSLIGSTTTALLIGHTGGILELAQIPSCNLASIGKNKYASHSTNTNISGVRQEGFIYHCDLIQNQDITVRKQMVRMVCAKVSLASRVDAGQSRERKTIHNLNNSLGQKWKNELLDKIAKLQEAPGIAATKALPIPEDQPKKKRAGRKFRKYKEQFKMSHLRQLQNRMEFGKQETTVMDSYGEEIGFGMSNSSLQDASNTRSTVNRNTNNKAKLNKTMKRRIEEANEQSNEYLLNLAENEHAFSEGGKQYANQNKKQKTTERSL